MLADATVYGVGLYAVGKEAFVKIKAAHIGGVLQALLGITVLLDFVRRATLGSERESLLIIWVGIVALVANIICLRLILRHKDAEVHMRGSWICSSCT